MTDGIPAVEFDPSARRALSYRQVAGLRLSRDTDEAGEARYFLKAPGGALLVLGTQEQFLWQSLDGTRSFAEIERGFRAQFGVALATPEFTKFLTDLLAAGALERVPESEGRPRRVTLSASPIKRIELADSTAAEERIAAPGNGAADPVAMPRRPEKFQNPISFTFHTSGRIFAALARVFWPIRYVSWVVIPLVFVGLMIPIKHSTEYIADWNVLFSTLWIWPFFWLSEHATTWSARFVEGAVIYGFGGEIKKIYIRLFMMFIRIKFDTEGEKALPRRQRLWIAAAPMIWRLFAFGAWQIVWIGFRSAHPVIGDIALLMAYMGFVSFFVSAMPLLPHYGYHFLSILIDQENLYGRAFTLLTVKLSGRPAPFTMSVAERWGLVVMAVGTVVVSTAYFGSVLYEANSSIAQMLNGLGGWVVLAIVVVSLTYFYALWRWSRKLRALRRVTRTGAGGRRRPEGRVAGRVAAPPQA